MWVARIEGKAAEVGIVAALSDIELILPDEPIADLDPLMGNDQPATRRRS